MGLHLISQPYRLEPFFGALTLEFNISQEGQISQIASSHIFGVMFVPLKGVETLRSRSIAYVKGKGFKLKCRESG